MRREKSLRNGVHHANAVVWGPVRDGTRLRDHGRAEVDVHGEEKEASRAILERVVDDAEDALFVRANVVLGDDVEPASATRALAVDLNRRGGEEGETGTSAGSVAAAAKKKGSTAFEIFFRATRARERSDAPTRRSSAARRALASPTRSRASPKTSRARSGIPRSRGERADAPSRYFKRSRERITARAGRGRDRALTATCCCASFSRSTTGAHTALGRFITMYGLPDDSSAGMTRPKPSLPAPKCTWSLSAGERATRGMGHVSTCCDPHRFSRRARERGKIATRTHRWGT